MQYVVIITISKLKIDFFLIQQMKTSFFLFFDRYLRTDLDIIFIDIPTSTHLWKDTR